MSISKLVAVADRPSPALASVFRILGTQLGDNFVALFGAPAVDNVADQAGTSKPDLLEGYRAKIISERGPFDVGRALRRAGVGSRCSVLFTDIESAFSATALVAAKALRSRLLLRFAPDAHEAASDEAGWTSRLWDRVSLSIFDCFLVGSTTDWRELEAEVRDPLIVFAPSPADGADHADLVANYSVVRREARTLLEANATDFVVAAHGATEVLVRAAHAVQDSSSIRLLVLGEPPDGTLAMMIESLPWKLPPIISKSHSAPSNPNSSLSNAAAQLCAADGFAHFRTTGGGQQHLQQICDAQRLGNVCLVGSSIRIASDLIVDGENGTVAKEDDVDELVAALTRLVEIRDRTSHIDVNNKILELFTAENCAGGILAAAKLGSTGALLARPPGLKEQAVT